MAQVFIIVGKVDGKEVYYPERGGGAGTKDPTKARAWSRREPAELKLSTLTGWKTMNPVVRQVDTLWFAVMQHQKESEAATAALPIAASVIFGFMIDEHGEEIARRHTTALIGRLVGRGVRITDPEQ
jgi:hypothetical protein